MDSLLSLLPMLKQYSGLLAAVAGVLVLTSQHWMPLLKGLKLPSFKKAEDDPSADLADVEALHLLQARAKRSKCPLLKKALRDVEVNFFNHVDAGQAAVNWKEEEVAVLSATTVDLGGVKS